MKKIVTILIFFVLIATIFSGCTNTKEDTNQNGDQSKEKEEDTNQYAWSTMNEGPYHDKISYATSTDLLTWTDSEIVLADHASVPGAIYKDNTIYVYFIDVSVDGLPERIGLITSNDNGLTWSDEIVITIDDIGDKVPVDPAPFLLDDGRIRLYYFDINEERIAPETTTENHIYAAISSDGIHFEEEGLCFSQISVYDPDVIQVDDTYRMYVGNLAENKVISATSADGITFTYEGTAYTGGAVPDVFYNNGTYYLYTAGINIATSTDSITFTATSSRFTSTLGITADPSVIELNDGTFMMLYKTKNLT
jgi:hypothetical protein